MYYTTVFNFAIERETYISRLLENNESEIKGELSEIESEINCCNNFKIETDVDLSGIDASEMWCLQHIFDIAWTVRTNASILSELRIHGRFSTICQQRIIQYFGFQPREANRLMESGWEATQR